MKQLFCPSRTQPWCACGCQLTGGILPGWHWMRVAPLPKLSSRLSQQVLHINPCSYAVPQEIQCIPSIPSVVCQKDSTLVVSRCQLLCYSPFEWKIIEKDSKWEFNKRKASAVCFLQGTRRSYTRNPPRSWGLFTSGFFSFFSQMIRDMLLLLCS